MKRLIVVGPVPPVRGGIARHTYHLSNAASKIIKTELLCPKRVFPRLLYPGGNQFVNSTDASYEFDQELSVRRGSWWQVLKDLIRLKGPREDVGILLVWWTWVLAPVSLAVGIIAKLRGMKVTLYCHNVVPHDVIWLGEVVTKFTLKRFQRFIVQSTLEQQLLTELQQFSKIKIVRHPTYAPIVEYPKRPKTESKRPNFLFFGLIRPYKGVGKLIDIIPQLSDLDVNLTIAGEAWDKKIDTELRVLDETYSRFSYVPGFASEELKSKLFRDADALILPYERATGSGVLADAIGFNRPVIVSDVIETGQDFLEGRDGITVNLQTHHETALTGAIRQFVGRFSEFDCAWTVTTHLPTWSQCAEEAVSSFDE
ncbi:glycosyltransferase [Aquiluna sp.]|nr:glycosyltransferase [Aquiluna sp.]